MKRVLVPAVMLLGGSLGIAACGSEQLCDNNACIAPAGDGGSDATTDSPSQQDSPSSTDTGSEGGGSTDAADARPDTAPPGCDTTKDPKDSLPCVDDKYGLFVDANKAVGGNGAKASPFNSITAAIAATGSLKRIYVCEGTYAEAVKVDGSHDGISIYGGWACADWSYSGNKPKLAPTTNASPPLRIDALTQGVTVEDLELDAKAGNATFVSSVAAFVTGSSGAAFSRVKFVAGAGQSGTDGATGSNYTATTQDNASITGNDASGANGGGLHLCALCANGVNSTGGAGGAGGPSPGDGTNGAPPVSGAVAPNDGAKGIAAAAATACTNGHGGASGLPASNAPGAQRLGSLDATGWKPEPGQASTTGDVGQGGGGGGGGISAAKGGAGGGGCGRVRRGRRDRADRRRIEHRTARRRQRGVGHGLRDTDGESGRWRFGETRASWAAWRVLREPGDSWLLGWHGRHGRGRRRERRGERWPVHRRAVQERDGPERGCGDEDCDDAWSGWSAGRRWCGGGESGEGRRAGGGAGRDGAVIYVFAARRASPKLA